MRNFFWAILFTLFFSSVSFANPSSVYVLNVQDAIGPAVEDYLSQGLSTANKDHASLVII